MKAYKVNIISGKGVLPLVKDNFNKIEMNFEELTTIEHL